MRNFLDLVDYQRTFEAVPVAMCVSRCRRIVACNPAAAAMFGYSTDALAGQSFLMLYPSPSEFLRKEGQVMRAAAHAEPCR